MAMLNNQMVDILYFMHTRTHAHTHTIYLNITVYFCLYLIFIDFAGFDVKNFLQKMLWV